MKRKVGALGQISLLSSAHAMNDFYALLFSPLLPLFEARFAMTHFVSTSLIMLTGIVGSMSQPLLGFLGDHFSSRGKLLGRKGMVVLGTVISAVFMSMIGLSSGVAWLAVFLVVGACGVGLFHPNAATMATTATRNMPGGAMSVFLMSGAIGIALAPLVITRTVSAFGAGATWVVMFPGLGLAVVIAAFLRDQPLNADTDHNESDPPSAAEANTLQLVWLFVATVVRSGVVVCFNNLIPLLAAELGATLTAGGRMQSVFLLSGCAGGIAAGFLSDRFSRHVIMLFSCVPSVPFLYYLTAADPRVATICLIAGGAILYAGGPLHVLLAQQMRPRAASTVSGVMMGLAWSIGGFMLPLFGWIADRLNTITALRVAALVPLLAAACLIFVRADKIDAIRHAADGETEVP